MVGLSEEEQNSMQIPSHMRCDACHAIAHKLTTNIREDGTQTREREEMSRNVSEWINTSKVSRTRVRTNSSGASITASRTGKTGTIISTGQV